MENPTGSSETTRKDALEAEVKKPRFSTKNKLIAALAGGALLAGVSGGIVAATSGEKAPEAPANTSEPLEPAPVDPGNGEGEPTTPEAPNAGEGLTFEADTTTLANETIDLVNEWVNAGAEPELFDRLLETTYTWEEFLPIVVEENAEKFTQYVADPTSNEGIALIENFKAANLATLTWYSATAFNTENPENIEGYKVTENFVNASELSNDGQIRVIEANTLVVNNSDKNSADFPLERASNPTYTYTNVDGQAKLVSITY